MATRQIVIPAGSLIPTGSCYMSRFRDEMTLTNTDPGDVLCVVMPDPAGGGDHGVKGTLVIPTNYSSTPVMRIIGVIDGTPANNLAFGVQMANRANSETFDAAYASEDTANNSTWTGYADEDVYIETVTLTNGAPSADEITSFFVYIDDSQATPYTGNFLLGSLVFEYDDGT